MAEFYEVLKRAVGALPGNTGDARRAVYERARKALIAQLEGFSPPLTPSEITSQRLSLEEAIRKVEGEAARAALGLGQSAAAKSQQRAPQASAPPPPPLADSTTFAPGAPDAKDDVSMSTVPGEGTAPLLDASGSTEDNGSAATLASGLDASKKAEIETPLVANMDAGSDSGNLAGNLDGAGPRIPPVASMANDDSHRIPPLAGSEDPSARAPSSMETAATVSGNDNTGSPAPLEANGFDDFPQEIRKSRLPMIVGILAGALVLVGLSAVLYSQRDALFGETPSGSELKAEVSPETDTAKVVDEPKPASRVVSPAPEKSSDRIPQSGGAVRTVPTQRVTAPSGAENGALNTVGTENTDTASPSSDTKATDDPAPTPTPTPAAPLAGDSSEDEVARVEPQPTPAPANTNTAGAVAQTAILYEEGTDGASGGEAVSGQVVWSKGSEAAVSVVSADVSIADKASNIKITIKPNTEDGFPASHLVEMQFTGPLGSAIKTVPGLIMKSTEQAQGDALVGAAIKVTDGLFWIALSAEGKDLSRNRSLLESRGWIDIPLLYASGKRAILTIEKGVPGGKVVETAFKDWAKN